MSFPAALPSYNGFTPSHTLATDQHGEQHNQEQADIIAIATKVGIGASTPANNTVLRGNGTGTTTYDQVHLATDVSGVLPTGNGGTGTNSTTGTGSNVFNNSPTLITPTITSPTENSGTYNSPVINNPVISGYPSNSIPAAAIVNNSLTASQLAQNAITPNTLDSVLGTSWAWQSFTPTFTLVGGGSNGNAVITGAYTQIGKTVHFWMKYVIGSSTTFSGMTQMKATLPVTATAAWVAGNFAGVFGGGGNGAVGNAPLTNFSTSTTDFRIVALNTASTYAGFFDISSTVPGTWNIGDSLWINGVYEAAT